MMTIPLNDWFRRLIGAAFMLLGIGICLFPKEQLFIKIGGTWPPPAGHSHEVFLLLRLVPSNAEIGHEFTRAVSRCEYVRASAPKVSFLHHR